LFPTLLNRKPGGLNCTGDKDPYSYAKLAVLLLTAKDIDMEKYAFNYNEDWSDRRWKSSFIDWQSKMRDIKRELPDSAASTPGDLEDCLDVLRDDRHDVNLWKSGD